MTVSTGGNPVAGTFTVEQQSHGTARAWGPGTILYFTPTTPLAASTTYTVAWGAPLADTAGNAVTPGSFTFTTGSGADTAHQQREQRHRERPDQRRHQCCAA